MNLTQDQLTAINRHPRKENWLPNEDLIAELTDHYANGISDRLARGVPFDTAIEHVHTGTVALRKLLIGKTKLA